MRDYPTEGVGAVTARILSKARDTSAPAPCEPPTGQASLASLSAPTKERTQEALMAPGLAKPCEIGATVSMPRIMGEPKPCKSPISYPY
jgi:hypothetical protein